MQPVWESVKHPNGETFYRNTYQRAHYNVDYDNYHDIYLQRWRKENKPWEVLCINKISKAERSVPIGSDVFCTEPDEYKVVIGQGLFRILVFTYS